MENQGKKTELLHTSGRDVLWDSVINDISGENADSARTERLIEKINRLCKCAACFLYTMSQVQICACTRICIWRTAIFLITEGGMGYEREAYPYGSAQGSDP